MKATGKKLTLSGQLPKRVFGQQLFRDPHTILEYSNVLDINRAWKVKSFRVWIQGEPGEMGITQPVYFTVDTQLSTDSIPGSTMWNNAGDNRAISWGTLAYNCAESPQKLAPGYSGFPRNLENSEYWIHPDNIVQNKLTISAHAFGAQIGVEFATYILNYLVELEEVEITPTESIVFNIKSTGQDLST